MSPIATGLVHMELNRGDGSLGTFLGVQAGLAMQSIAMLGSEEQKQRWLPAMAQLDNLGAFALTEPTHGSDSVALETSASRDGDTWVINGEKKWIGNGTIADVVVLWARDIADGQVKGFLVEKGTPGYDARRIDGKGSLRAGVAGPHHPDRRAGARGQPAAAAPRASRTPRRVLAGTRNAVAWAALGHATAAYEIAHRLLPAAHAVRQTPGQLPDRAGHGWSRCSPRCARCSCTACGSAGCMERGRADRHDRRASPR